MRALLASLLLAAPAQAMQLDAAERSWGADHRVGLVTDLGAVVPFRGNELGVNFGAGARFAFREISCDGTQYAAPAIALLATGTWSTSLTSEPRGGWLSGLAGRLELLAARHQKILVPWLVGWLTAGGGLGPDSQGALRGAGWVGIGGSFNLWAAAEPVVTVGRFFGGVLFLVGAVAACIAGVAVGGPSGGVEGALTVAGLALVAEAAGLFALSVVNVEVRYAVRQVAGGAQGYGMIVMGVGL
jgi:hypothetical protein